MLLHCNPLVNKGPRLCLPQLPYCLTRPWFPHLIHSVCPSSRHLASYWPDFTHAFLGHKLWQESWWLCCPESSNVRHTETHTYSCEKVFSPTPLLPSLDRHVCLYPERGRQKETRMKVEGWGNKMLQQERRDWEENERDEKWVKGNLFREETGSDCNLRERQRGRTGK